MCCLDLIAINYAGLYIASSQHTRLFKVFTYNCPLTPGRHVTFVEETILV